MFQGVIGTETSARWVSSRRVKRLSIPRGAFGFCFADADPETGGWTRRSKTYFVDGDVANRQTLHQLFSQDETASALESFPNTERFFRPRTGGLFPMGPSDIALLVERTVSL